MAEDDKNKATSLPPPPTDEIDDEWGSSSHASSGPSAGKSSGKSASKTASKTEKASTASKRRDVDDEDEEEDDDEEDELDEDEEEDDDEDEEEDDDAPHKARARQAAAKRAAAESSDFIPDWAPWATLGGLLSIGLLGGVGIIPIDFSLKKSTAEPIAAAVTPAPTGSALKRSASARRPNQPPPDAQGAAAQERVAASHLLVSYQGAMRAAPTITRTKDEAKKRAQTALARAKKGEDFGKLVAEFSDEPGAATRGGKLGKFPRQAMVKPFADAAFNLKPGQVSDVVETDFGFHVILRTE